MRDMWQGRAINFMEAITPPLSFLADKGFVLFNPKLLCDFYLLSNIENLLYFGILIDLNGKVVNLKDGSEECRRIYNEMSEKYCGNLRRYVESLPGYAPPRQPQRPLHMKLHMKGAGLGATAVPVQLDLPPSDGWDGEPEDKEAQKAQHFALEQHNHITYQLLLAMGDRAFNPGDVTPNHGHFPVNRRPALPVLPNDAGGEAS